MPPLKEWFTQGGEVFSAKEGLQLQAAAKKFAEKLGSAASGAKALGSKKGFIAALKALRHPTSSFSANCKEVADRAELNGAAGSRALSKRGNTSKTGQHIEFFRNHCRACLPKLHL